MNERIQIYDNRSTQITENRRKVVEAYEQAARRKRRNQKRAMIACYVCFGALAFAACRIAGWL